MFEFYIIINNEGTEMLIYPGFSLGLAFKSKNLIDEPSAAVYYNPIILFYPDGDLTYCFQACA
jgi:hypothetical protein